jgi:hypothetical protein
MGTISQLDFFFKMHIMVVLHTLVPARLVRVLRTVVKDGIKNKNSFFNHLLTMDVVSDRHKKWKGASA